MLAYRHRIKCDTGIRCDIEEQYMKIFRKLQNNFMQKHHTSFQNKRHIRGDRGDMTQETGRRRNDAGEMTQETGRRRQRRHDAQETGRRRQDGGDRTQETEETERRRQRRQDAGEMTKET